MTNKKEIIQKFQETIVGIYREQKLISLRGNNDYVVNGQPVLSAYYKATRKGSLKYSGNFDFNQNFDDIVFCSDEILYFLASMYLYLPYMNSPLQDGHKFNGEMVYPNLQNLEAKRYSMMANLVSEKLYNYWDRIGDLLAAYFPELLKPHEVLFAKIIDVFPEEYHEDENYKWLKNFKEDEFRELNKKRKQIVHYVTEGTKFKYDHLDGTEAQIKKLISDRNQLADYYRIHLQLALDGFAKVLLLIDKITEETLGDVG